MLFMTFLPFSIGLSTYVYANHISFNHTATTSNIDKPRPNHLQRPRSASNAKKEVGLSQVVLGSQCLASQPKGKKSKRVAEGNNPAIFLPPVSARGGYLDGSRAGVVARPLTKALDSPEKTPLFRNEKECFTMRYRASQTRGCCSHATTFTAWGINLFIFDVLLRCCDLFGRLNHYWLLTGNRGGM